MKVLVFGATGGTGFQVVQQALENGHHVTAFVRNPLKINIKHNNLNIMQGDVLKQDSIEKAMQGQDAVICCLGMPAYKAGTLRSEGTANIIKAMQKSGVSRLICQTSLGFDDSVDVLKQTSYFFKHLIVPFLLKTTFDDHKIQEDCITKSGINYTIVRPGNLTNGALTGNYKYGFDYTDTPLKVKISRADAADFIIKQLNSNSFSFKKVGVSY